MYSKKEILGIRCEIVNSSGIELDERAILLGGNSFIVKKRHLGILKLAEKFAVLGESPFFLQVGALVDFHGPRWCGNYLARINSRGFLKESLVPEKDLILLDGRPAA